MISRQRQSQLRHRERHQARACVIQRVKSGTIPPARKLLCIDCGVQAEAYDHARGYTGENKVYVEAVCWNCHRERGRSRGEYRNGHMNTS